MPRPRMLRRARLLLPVVLIWALLIADVVHAQPTIGSQEAGTRQITLSEEEASLFETFLKLKGWVQDYSPRTPSLETLYQGAMRGMVEAVDDPYSRYLTKDQYESLSSSLEGDYVGVGITIDLIDGRITVINTFRGSPAEAAGIKAGDVIVGVDGQDLRGKLPSDAQVLLRGEVDTPVSITLQRPSAGTNHELRLVRAVISQGYLDVEDLGDGVAYIYISQFTTEVSRDFRAVLDFLRVKGLEGLVLDLRGNPGGLLDACIEIASELVPKGPIVELRRGELKESIDNETTPTIVPVVVLVNRGSASASEILAGAIHDRGVGIVLGERTFGKACVQTVIGMGGQGGVRLTIADYYTPSGLSLADTGLTPDIAVKVEEVTMPATFEYKRPMTTGLVGLDVLALQESLSFLGYDLGTPDGIFGKATLAAVSSFLSDQGSVWNGALTERDADLLHAAIAHSILNQRDSVMEAGLEALRGRLKSGHWPLLMPDI